MINVTAANFQEEVLDHKGPVLVDFWAPWCMPCRILGPVLDKLAKDYEGKLKVVKLNTDENQATAAQYQIMSIPTMIAFKDGEQIERVSGALPEDQLKQLFDKILAV